MYGGDLMDSLTEVDAKITGLQTQLHDHTWDPDEAATIRVEIDQLLDQRQALTHG